MYYSKAIYDRNLLSDVASAADSQRFFYFYFVHIKKISLDIAA